MLSLVALVLLFGGLLNVVLGTSLNRTRRNDRVPGAYIVEFADDHDTDSFYHRLGLDDISVSLRVNLSYALFKGASFNVLDLSSESETARRIASLPTVKQMWPVRLVPAPNDTVQTVKPISSASLSSFTTRQDSNEPDTYSPHVMTQIDKLRAAGYNGTGVRIAIVDTGVDYNHPALGGGFGPGHLVSYGYDLVGDNYDGYNDPVPDPDPHDYCEGHGTHVAGIIAAQPNDMDFTGAAPGVSLGAYRVFPCYGPTSEDILIAAFNKAHDDHSDIISASIGEVSGWSESPWSVAVERIVSAGTPCILSAGNDGFAGLFAASDAANGKGATSVASFDNVDDPLLLAKGTYTTSAANSTARFENRTEIPFGWYPGYPMFGSVSLPLRAVSNDSTVLDDACEGLPSETPDLSNYIVLIRNGTCDFDVQARNVAAFGARYIIFYASTDKGIYGISLSQVTELEGVGTVLASQGEKWVDLLGTGTKVDVAITDPSVADLIVVNTPNHETGGLVSSYTSWGPTWDLDIYPDIGAPGYHILSTYLLSEGGYLVMSGTSMAAPLAAAAYALVGQARGTFDPKELGNVLASTAHAQVWNNSTSTFAALAPVPQQGPGLIQAYDAAMTKTLLSVQSISFNDSAFFIPNVTVSITNTGTQGVLYTLNNVPALSMYTFDEDGDSYPSYFPNPVVDETATLEFSETSLVVRPRETVEIVVTATPPERLNQARLPVYSGYITINGTNGDDLAVPYLGVVGRLHDATVLDVSSTCLASPLDRKPAAANTTFVMPYPTIAEAENPSYGINYPTVVYSLNVGSPILRFDVVSLDADSTNPTSTVLGTDIVGSVYDTPVRYESRVTDAVVFTGMLADGTVAPEGRYELAIKALKIFGDPDDADDYESITTVSFTLVYET